MATPEAITAISQAADSLFKEIGATVRQLGGKRQKALDIAAEMQMQRAERLREQSAPQREASMLPWVLGAMALIIVVAIVVKNKQ